jgi:hypothetical protein
MEGAYSAINPGVIVSGWQRVRVHMFLTVYYHDCYKHLEKPKSNFSDASGCSAQAA